MLRSIHNLIGFTIGATDGEIGKVKDFYFDDETWKIKYLVVETGNWLTGRKVLLSPVALQSPYWDSESFPVNLNKEQIKHSPDIDTDKPVSKQQEAELHKYYSWPYNEGAGVGFMTTGMIGGVVAPDIPFEDKIAQEVHQDENPEETFEAVPQPTGDRHLRSFKETTGYTAQATNGEVGEVEDFLIDDKSWHIPFMVVETGNWYSGKKILTPTDSISRIEWEDSSVHVNQTTDSLKSSPEFDYSQTSDENFGQNRYYPENR